MEILHSHNIYYYWEFGYEIAQRLSKRDGKSYKFYLNTHLLESHQHLAISRISDVCIASIAASDDRPTQLAALRREDQTFSYASYEDQIQLTSKLSYVTIIRRSDDEVLHILTGILADESELDPNDVTRADPRVADCANYYQTVQALPQAAADPESIDRMLTRLLNYELPLIAVCDNLWIRDLWYLYRYEEAKLRSFLIVQYPILESIASDTHASLPRGINILAKYATVPRLVVGLAYQLDPQQYRAMSSLHTIDSERLSFMRSQIEMYGLADAAVIATHGWFDRTKPTAVHLIVKVNGDLTTTKQIVDQRLFQIRGYGRRSGSKSWYLGIYLQDTIVVHILYKNYWPALHDSQTPSKELTIFWLSTTEQVYVMPNYWWACMKSAVL